MLNIIQYIESRNNIIWKPTEAFFFNFTDLNILKFQLMTNISAIDSINCQLKPT